MALDMVSVMNMVKAIVIGGASNDCNDENNDYDDRDAIDNGDRHGDDGYVSACDAATLVRGPYRPA